MNPSTGSMKNYITQHQGLHKHQATQVEGETQDNPIKNRLANSRLAGNQVRVRSTRRLLDLHRDSCIRELHMDVHVQLHILLP
jgi:hypothetical protein